MNFHHLESSLSVTGPGQNMGLVTLLKQSQKFYAGEVMQLPHLRELGDIRLPYPKSAFEFSVGVPNEPKDTLIVLAQEVDEEFMHFQMCLRLDRGWKHVGFALFDRSANKWTGDRGGAGELVDIAAGWTARFLSVLNCSNVESVSIQPSDALNKKRMKAGKLPVYEYKVLNIRRSGRATGGSSTEATHRRVHLVRGHIKRRSSGNFWWQPHARGSVSAGMVVKDYRADRLLLNSVNAGAR